MEFKALLKFEDNSDILTMLIIAFTVTPYYKNKLRGLYNNAMQDAEGEAE